MWMHKVSLLLLNSSYSREGDQRGQWVDQELQKNEIHKRGRFRSHRQAMWCMFMRNEQGAEHVHINFCYLLCTGQLCWDQLENTHVHNWFMEETGHLNAWLSWDFETQIANVTLMDSRIFFLWWLTKLFSESMEPPIKLALVSAVADWWRIYAWKMRWLPPTLMNVRLQMF